MSSPEPWGGSISSSARRIMLFAACLGSAACWVLIRIPTGRGIHRSMAARCVQLEMRPSDWPCRVTEGHAVAVYLAACAFVSLAIVLPSLVLAMKGRRVLAFVPMTVPVVVVALDALATWIWSGVWVHVERTSVSPIFVGPWEPWSAASIAAPWRPNDLIAIIADLVVLALPIVVYLVLFRPAKPARWTFGWRAALLAVFFAIGASALIEWVANVANRGLYVGGSWFLPGLILMTFGLLLPLGWRRPLWAIAPVAILASLGPSTMLIGTLYRYSAFSWFRTALPLTLIGLAGAASVSLVARQRGYRPADLPERPFRLGALAYGAALGSLAVTIVMSILDPLPYEVATTLPTYLGARERVEDLRSRMTLDRALASAEAYRERTGTFLGFDASEAEHLDGGLLWGDGLPGSEDMFGSERIVRIATAAERHLDLIIVAQPTTYCLRLGPGVTPTYGAADSGRPGIRARAALARCADSPWTDDLLRPFPVERFCDQAADITMCRAVQKVMRDVLAAPLGA